MKRPNRSWVNQRVSAGVGRVWSVMPCIITFMPKRMRLGVVGAGSIAQRAPLAHFSVGDVKDRVVLGAVCDPVPGRAKAAAAKFGVPEYFESYAKMLASA